MTPPLLDHAAIAARIPHAGRMCLLDRVIAWDEDGIVCESDGHRTDDRDRRRDGPHPLARDGALPATAAIEYAAQAMALHGALIGERAATAAGAAVDEPAGGFIGREPARGFLAGLRSVRLGCRWIPSSGPSLTIRARRFAGDSVQVLYDFDVEAAGPIAAGRAGVILDAGRRTGQ